MDLILTSDRVTHGIYRNPHIGLTLPVDLPYRSYDTLPPVISLNHPPSWVMYWYGGRYNRISVLDTLVALWLIVIVPPVFIFIICTELGL